MPGLGAFLFMELLVLMVLFCCPTMSSGQVRSDQIHMSARALPSVLLFW